MEVDTAVDWLPDKSSAVDYIPISLLKDVAHIVITYLFNLSLSCKPFSGMLQGLLYDAHLEETICPLGHYPTCLLFPNCWNA